MWPLYTGGPVYRLKYIQDLVSAKPGLLQAGCFDIFKQVLLHF